MVTHGHKRSWRNYLLDAGFQLRFTLMMVAIAAGLMAPLGWYVSVKASRATEVSVARLDGVCPSTDSDNRTDQTEFYGRKDVVVEIDDSGMPGVDSANESNQVTPRAVKNSRDECLAKVSRQKEDVRARETLIFFLLIGSGVLVLVGLGVLGIVMTHKVAGPLFKVGMYFDRLGNESYETVVPLRKGDQLSDFYEGFRSAHDGLRTMQEEDLEQLLEAIALAKDAGLEEMDGMKQIVRELELYRDEKEKSLGA